MLFALAAAAEAAPVVSGVGTALTRGNNAAFGNATNISGKPHAAGKDLDCDGASQRARGVEQKGGGTYHSASICNLDHPRA